MSHMYFTQPGNFFTSKQGWFHCCIWGKKRHTCVTMQVTLDYPQPRIYRIPIVILYRIGVEHLILVWIRQHFMPAQKCFHKGVLRRSSSALDDSHSSIYPACIATFLLIKSSCVWIWQLQKEECGMSEPSLSLTWHCDSMNDHTHLQC